MEVQLDVTLKRQNEKAKGVTQNSSGINIIVTVYRKILFNLFVNSPQEGKIHSNGKFDKIFAPCELSKSPFNDIKPRYPVKSECYPCSERLN